MDKRHFQKRPTSGKIVPLENASSSALFRRDMSSMFMARLGSQFSRGTHFTNRSTDPRIEDGLGRNAFAYLKMYGPFPKVHGLMERATRSLSLAEASSS